MSFSNAAFLNDENEVDKTMNNSTVPLTKDNTEWDIFQENLDKSKRVKGDEIWKSLAKVLTISLTVLLFLIVLGTGVISRITLHIMMWHLNPPPKTATDTDNTNSTVTSIGMSGNPGLSLTENSTTSQTGNTTVSFDEAWIWSLFIVVIAPYVFTTFDCLKTICLKKTRKVHWRSLLIILILETLHSIGLCCMVYIVLPMFNAPSASIVYLAVLFVLPIIDTVNVCCNKENGNESTTGYICKMVPSMFGFLLQVLGIFMICFFISKEISDNYRTFYIIVFVVSAILISFKYWNTFTEAEHRDKWLPHLKWIYLTRRTRMMLIVHLWKLLLSGIAVLVIHCLKAENPEDGIKAIFNAGTATLKEIFGSYEISNDETCEKYVPFIIAVINISSSYVCSKAAKVACVIGCQRLCFSLPLNVIVPVVTPVLLGTLMYFPEILQFTDCDVYFAQVNLENILEIKNTWILIVAGAALILSLLCVTWHVWKTNGYILGKTQSVFNEPIYCGVFSDMSLLLNRGRNDEEYNAIIQEERKTEMPTSKEHIVDDRPKIYACATMWHETETEMTQLLKSIFRMDKHQRNLDLAHNLKKGSNKKTQRQDDSDFCYDFEAHIFFDDAFEVPVDSTTYPAVNEYVTSLISVMDKSASAVHGRVGQLAPFTITKTPYGGRLTWELTNRNKLFVHLKDKTKIRHKKRWSQVMYMYYFFGHKLGKNADRIANESFNTFLLALDGDVDFQPEAVMHLVRRMKKNPIVGAACGRIHPIGTGPLVWYQKFEYAVSHWLQKATEHVIGCVLCSPGCFSLFRGSALMDVLKIYTKIPTDARHFIQYDQGEDRWLCTLLLKHGYRVEYCAESDALTFAPEGFNEFYNQRRRWTPSTMANILDLLADWNRVIKENQNISTLYMFYQLFLFISSLLTPGTIFLMIVGAIIVGFPSMPPWLVLTLNVIPVGLFMLSCIFTKSQTQLLFAGILSGIYAVVMMIVLVGVLKEAVEVQFCSITTIFLCFVAGVFIVSAILHPMEASCIFHGILYFICIPSMSMLMVLYSLGNLHVVSWGTREVKTATPTSQQGQTEKSNGGYSFSFGNIFRCICCPTDNVQQKNQCNKDILDKLSSLENQIGKIHVHTDPQSVIGTRLLDTSNDTHPKEEIKVTIVNEDALDSIRQNDGSMKISFDEAAQLSKEEQQFWEHLILEYLKPLEKNVAKEKKVQSELIDLRNRSCLFFFLANALLVTVIYALTHTSAYNKSLSIDIPCDASFLSIEPISITFTVIFGILLFIQFICLLFHRFSTLIHITATTKIKSEFDENEELNIALDVLQRTGSLESKTSAMTDDFKGVFEKKKRRRIQQMVEKSKIDNRKTVLDLEENMRENLGKIPAFDTTEGEGRDKYESNKMAEFNEFVKKSGHLTEKELKIMKKFILTDKHKILQRSIEHDQSTIYTSENTEVTSV